MSSILNEIEGHHGQIQLFREYGLFLGQKFTASEGLTVHSTNFSDPQKPIKEVIELQQDELVTLGHTQGARGSHLITLYPDTTPNVLYRVEHTDIPQLKPKWSQVIKHVASTLIKNVRQVNW